MAELNLGIRGHDIVENSPLQLGKCISKLGLKNVQLAPCKSFPDLAPSFDSLTLGTAARIRSELSEESIFVSILGCYVNISEENKENRRVAISNFKRSLFVCNAFGANMVGTETCNYKEGYSRENFSLEAYKIARESISEMVEYAERVGAIVAIEPCFNHSVYDADRACQLIEDIRSDHLRFILDFSNLLTCETFAEQERIMKNTLQKLDGYVEHFHLKDCKIIENKLQAVPVGQGDLDFEPILQYIKSNYPSMSMTFEETKEADVEKAIQYIQEIYDSCS